MKAYTKAEFSNKNQSNSSRKWQEQFKFSQNRDLRAKLARPAGLIILIMSMSAQQNYLLTDIVSLNNVLIIKTAPLGVY